MTELIPAQLGKFIRGISVRQVRLACGFVLFAYLVSHFVNHALGNISLGAMAKGIEYHKAFWQMLPVAIVFYSAATAHTGLGFWALYERRQFRWKAIEPIQLALGLSVPALIITHLAGVRIAEVLFQDQKLYPQVFYAYWIVSPYKMWLMYIVLIISWVHGCIGLYFWLRMKTFLQTQRRFSSPRQCSFQRLQCWAFIRADEQSCSKVAAQNGRRKTSLHVRSARQPSGT